jgi:hypothetical protein
MKDGACLGCLLRDGEFLSAEQDLECHPRGRCTAVPAVRGQDKPIWEDGTSWLLNKDEAGQREILGNARYELWQDGMPLEKFSGLSHSDVWGDAPMVVPLNQLSK